MGLTHLCALVKLNESTLFQGVTVKSCLSVTSESVPCVYTLAPKYPCCMSSHCYSIMYQWCRACLLQTLVPTCINACPHLNKPEFQPLSQVLFACTVPWALGALYGSRSTYKVAQCTNIHHNNCCHPLDKKSHVPVTMADPLKVIGDMFAV